MVAAALALPSACSCTERTLDDPIPESERDKAACMWIFDAKLLSADESRHWLIQDEAREGTGAVCLCLTQAQFDMKARFDELNDMALAECEHLAAADSKADQYDHNNCQELHDDGQWLDDVYWLDDPTVPDNRNPPKGVSCP